MNITEVRVKMVNDETERLRAFCSVTFDEAFVIRDLKVIDGSNGPFVAMPSRKLTDRCPRCASKNHLRARFCNDCGAKLNENRAPRDPEGRIKLQSDVAHPINAPCREQIQDAVIKAYTEELDLSSEPDDQLKIEDHDATSEEQTFDDGITKDGIKDGFEDDDATGEDQAFDDGITTGDDETEQKSDYEEFLSDLRESVGKRRDALDDQRHVESTDRQTSLSATDQSAPAKTETEKPPALSPDDDTFGAGIL